MSITLTTWRGESRAEIDSARANAVFAPRGTQQQSIAADIALASYVLTLCAEFQHYCDRVYFEAVDALEAQTGAATNALLAKLLRVNLTQGRALQRGNPGYKNLVDDFTRLGVDLGVGTLGQRTPTYPADKLQLDELLAVRNALVHGNARIRELQIGNQPRPPDVGAADGWMAAVDRIAGTLDNELTTALTGALGRAPW